MKRKIKIISELQMKILAFVLALSVFAAAMPANGQSLPRATSPAPVYNNCWDLAAIYYKVDAWLLFAIASHESKFTSGAIGKNSNGTQDLGIMQINTIHLPAISRYGVSRDDILNDNCKGIYFAAMLLRDCINKYGNNIDGVGCYHSRTPSRRRRYGAMVLAEYRALVQKHYIRKDPFALRH